MKIKRGFATTATIITFFIVGASGVMLFFHIKPGSIKLIHEYVGLAMVIACILHIVPNFSPFKKYFIGKKLAIIMFALLVGIGAIYSIPSKQKPPLKEVYSRVIGLNLSQAIKILNTDQNSFNKFLNDNHLYFNDVSVKKFAEEGNLKVDAVIKALLKSDN